MNDSAETIAWFDVVPGLVKSCSLKLSFINELQAMVVMETCRKCFKQKARGQM